MAEKEQKTTSLVGKSNGSMSIPGTHMPSEFERFISEGFAQVETVVFGDAEANKIPFYIGQLMGPADAVNVGEEVVNPKTGEVSRNTMPCWVFKPIGKADNGSIGVVENVTHVVPCNYQVDAACKRVWDTAQRDNKKAVVAVRFIGRERIRGGSRQLNRYSIFERFYDRNAAITG